MVEESGAEGLELDLVEDFVGENPVHAFGRFQVCFRIFVIKEHLHVNFQVLVAGDRCAEIVEELLGEFDFVGDVKNLVEIPYQFVQVFQNKHVVGQVLLISEISGFVTGFGSGEELFGERGEEIVDEFEVDFAGVVGVFERFFMPLLFKSVLAHFRKQNADLQLDFTL